MHNDDWPASHFYLGGNRGCLIGPLNMGKSVPCTVNVAEYPQLEWIMDPEKGPTTA